jgi:hypothetical protein
MFLCCTRFARGRTWLRSIGFPRRSARPTIVGAGGEGGGTLARLCVCNTVMHHVNLCNYATKRRIVTRKRPRATGPTAGTDCNKVIPDRSGGAEESTFGTPGNGSSPKASTLHVILRHADLISIASQITPMPRQTASIAERRETTNRTM